MMKTSGTTEERFLSVSDEDIQKECKKYPEERYNFAGAILWLIEAKEMIRKAYFVIDRLSISNGSLLGRLTDSAADNFLSIFSDVQNYSIASESGAGNATNHDRIVARINRFLQSITSREPWNKENGNLQPNPIIDAYLLALQLEQQSREIPDVGTLKSKIKDLEGQAKTVAESLGKSAGVEVLRTFGQHYETEATAQIKPSRFWLRAGVVSVFLLIIVICCFYLNMGCSLFGTETSSMNWTDPHVISNIIGRIVLLSIFAFLARFGFHQYSIRMHQLSAYRQKEVLANTFELFLASETMSSRRDLIMTEVIGSLATFVPDGYIRKDKPELNPLGEIAKLIASFKSKEQ